MDSNTDTLEKAMMARQAIASALGLSRDFSWGDAVACVTATVDSASLLQSQATQHEADFEALTNRYQKLAEEHEATKRNLRRALDSVTNLSQICLSDHNA